MLPIKDEEKKDLLDFSEDSDDDIIYVNGDEIENDEKTKAKDKCYNFLYYTCIVLLLTPIYYLAYPNSKYQKYDYYVFAQQWPSSLCKSINETHHGQCNLVPKGVNTWAVHGLWPSRAHTKKYGPFSCNQTWHYDHKTIQPFLGNMNKYWPNLMQNKPDDSFWSHEWEKHGTCACQQDQPKNEPHEKWCHREADYFLKALEVRKQVDFDAHMKKNKIIPHKTKTYTFAQVKKVLGDGRYQCYDGTDDVTTDNKPKPTHQVLAQVMICLDKDFHRQGCDQYGEEITGDFDTGPYNPKPCAEDVPVLIYPIHMKMADRP